MLQDPQRTIKTIIRFAYCPKVIRRNASASREVLVQLSVLTKIMTMLMMMNTSRSQIRGTTT